MKKPVSIGNVFERDPYRSILNLLIEFGELEQKHFRYALIPNHDKDTLHKWTFNEMELFFSNRLISLITLKSIKEGCITSRNNLNKFIGVLSDLGAIKRITKGKKIYYRISDELILKGERLRNKEVFDLYKHVMINHIEQSERHIIYGMTKDMYNLFSKEDRDKIDKYLCDIEEKLIEIDLIRSNYVFSTIHKNLTQKISHKFKDNELASYIIAVTPLLTFFKTFDSPYELNKSNDKPRGFPFEYSDIDPDDLLAPAIRIHELSDNIIRHRDELIDLMGFTRKEGIAFFEMIKQLCNYIDSQYDLNIISYSYISRDLQDTALTDYLKKCLH